MMRTKTVVVTLENEDIYTGPLALVNRANPVRAAIPAASLSEVAPGVLLERQAAALYARLVQSVGGEGLITPVSGFRKRSEQEQIFAEALLAHGEDYAATYVALPGCSEHETGLAIDVAKAGDAFDFVTPSFPYAGVCQRFRRAAAGYGFIQRYPEGKQHITGIGHEPWHFRYVGVPHALLMEELGQTLEEYHRWVKNHPWQSAPCTYRARGRAFTIGWLPARPGATEAALQGEPYTISGNNVDGFILAVWGGAA